MLLQLQCQDNKKYLSCDIRFAFLQIHYWHYMNDLFVLYLMPLHYTNKCHMINRGENEDIMRQFPHRSTIMPIFSYSTFTSPVNSQTMKKLKQFSIGCPVKMQDGITTPSHMGLVTWPYTFCRNSN